jgi:hypothetical protein
MMKKNIFTFVFALFVGLGFAQAQSAEKQLGGLLQDYYTLKDALVASDGKQSAEAAKKMMTSLMAIDASKLNESQASTFNTLKTKLHEDIEHIGDTQAVSHQRDHFKTLSENMITLVKTVDLESDVYQQYCPMANKNQGGAWLSAQKEVRNPYYGSMMLKCGSVKATL